MARKPRSRNRNSALALALVAALLWPTATRADATAAFLEASAQAYAPYRGALSYLHTGNAGLAALALEDMAARWAALCDRFRDQPPAAFAEDPAWQASLDAITGRIETARAQLESGDTAGATAALAPIRAVLGDLRRRNGIVTFTDRIDAFSAAMATMWVHRRANPDGAPGLGGGRGRPAREDRRRPAVPAPDRGLLQKRRHHRTRHRGARPGVADQRPARAALHRAASVVVFWLTGAGGGAPCIANRRNIFEFCEAWAVPCGGRSVMKE